MKAWILLLAGISAAASGQDVYPNRAVHITVPFTPGTGADILARVLGPRLAERWKSAVVVENRVGATGNIGTEYVAKAAPDGYTLLFTATSFGTNPALVRTLPFDPVKSFAPVILAATSSVAVIVNPQVPAKSLREFIVLARGQPGKLHYSSPGNGGPQHLAMELLKLEAGIDLVHVPYKGAGGAITDLIGGHVQAMISALQTVAPHVQSGKLRMHAVMSGGRHARALRRSGEAGAGALDPRGRRGRNQGRLMEPLEDLVAAYRILAEHGVIDAYGHVSLRSPRDPTRYYLARSIAPEKVQEEDLLEYDLDSRPLDAQGRESVRERFIHGEIYRSRPEVMAVVHNHSPSVVP